MSILFYSSDQDGDSFRIQLQQRLEEHHISQWPDCDPEQIKYAVVWNPPEDIFNGLSNLEGIFSIAAGVDHLLKHPGLPKNVPIVRIEDGGMGEKMAEYVLYGVLTAQRSMHHYRNAQRKAFWDLSQPDNHASEFRIGIMGIGAMGLAAASRLLSNGYKVSGWSAKPKNIDNIDCYNGTDQLPQFLSQLDVLVCLLPLTPKTTGILNSELFQHLPEQTYLINAARGSHLPSQDLLKALDTGRISGALLDVTDPEPLPNDHAFWNHPDIIITPHVAAPTQATIAMEQISANIRQMDKGEPCSGLVDTSRGY